MQTATTIMFLYKFFLPVTNQVLQDVLMVSDWAMPGRHTAQGKHVFNIAWGTRLSYILVLVFWDLDILQHSTVVLFWLLAFSQGLHFACMGPELLAYLVMQRNGKQSNTCMATIYMQPQWGIIFDFYPYAFYSGVGEHNIMMNMLLSSSLHMQLNLLILRLSSNHSQEICPSWLKVFYM